MSPIQDKLAAEEECRRTEEEDRWCKIALESLTDAQREKFAADPLDVILPVVTAMLLITLPGSHDCKRVLGRVRQEESDLRCMSR